MNLFIFSILASIYNVYAQDTLRFVQIIFRHGDRTPTKLLPSDKRGESIWPNGLEQLTKKGIQQEYELGQYFRKTYYGFLNQTYVADEISTLSTDKDRALMSAYSVLAGLYPPVDSQKWGTDKNIQLGQLWQPLPVKSTDYNANPLISADVPCQRFNRLYQQALSSPEAMNLTQQNQAQAMLEGICKIEAEIVLENI